MSHYRRRMAVCIGLFLVVIGTSVGRTIAAHAADVEPFHHAILEGVPTCSENGEHIIDWYIGNSVPKKPMTILSAAAVLNGTTYSVDGYANPVDPAGSTTATSTIPGSEIGTVTITVRGHWTDGHHSIRHADVVLDEPCVVTTTTEPTTVTTAPKGTTTTKPGDTTTLPPGQTSPPVSECTTQETPTTVAGTPCGPLSFTGNSPWRLVLGALALIVFGLAILFSLFPPRPRRAG